MLSIFGKAAIPTRFVHYRPHPKDDGRLCFHSCLSVHTCGGGGDPSLMTGVLPMLTGGGGGVGGNPSEVCMGVLPSQAWKGVPLPISGWGYPHPGKGVHSLPWPGKGVPCCPDLERGYPIQNWEGGWMKGALDLSAALQIEMISIPRCCERHIHVTQDRVAFYAYFW